MPNNLADFLRQNRLLTRQMGDLDTEILIAYVLKCDRIDLYKNPERTITSKQEHLIKQLLKRRQQGFPVAYLTGHKEFMSLDFIVNKNVLIPRPETELLVEETLRGLTLRVKSAESRKVVTVLDIGTGSGNIAVSVAKHSPEKNIRVFASDISIRALRVAELNARRHKVKRQIKFLGMDLFAPELDKIKGKIDIIVSNPPYVAKSNMRILEKSVRDYEPASALYGGRDGLDIIRRIIKQAPEYLKPGGCLLMEIGIGQAKQIEKIARRSKKYKNIKILSDYGKIPRVFVARTQTN